MSANLQLAGTYQVRGRKLISQDKPFSLFLGHRKNQSHTKPDTFLVAKTTTGHPFPDTGKPDQYVSSVYPTGEQYVTRIDYQGTGYLLTWEPTGDRVIIQPGTQMAKNNNSHL